MPALLKLLKWCGCGLLLVVVLILGAVAFVATTETGLHWAWSVARSHLPAGIEIAAVEGRLIGPLELHGLVVETDTMRLGLAQATLRWDANALLRGLVHIQTVHLQGLEYTALPGTQESPPESAPFTLPNAIRLPVDIILDALVLDHAEIRMAPDAEPVVVRKLRVAATLDEESWRVTTLTADGPLFQVSGSATLIPANGYAHHLRLQWRLAPPDLAPIQGHATLAGDLSLSEARLQLAPPYNLRARAAIRDPLESLAIQAEVTLAEARLAAIRDDLAPVSLSVDARVAGGLQDLGFKLDLTASHPRQGSARLDLNGHYNGQLIHIETLKVTSPDVPGHIIAHGDIALAAGHAMDLVLQWQDLQWPLQGKPTLVSRSGHFTVTGPLDAYRADGRLRWRLTEQDQAGRLRVGGNGSMQAFRLQTLVLNGAPGKLTGQARIVWAPRLHVGATLSGTDLNPGAILPDWPGDFDLVLKLQAKQQDDGLHAHLQKLRVEGSLRGQPLALDVVAHYAPDRAVVETLHLVAGATTLRASGQVSEPMQLRFELASDDLGTTLPGASGRITAAGRINGAYRQPNIVATLDAQELAYAGARLEQLALDADIHWSEGRHTTLNVVASGGDFGGLRLKRAQIQGSGMPRDHRLSLTVDSSEGDAAVALTGDFEQRRGIWNFVLQKAQLAYRELQPWRLADPARGRVTASAQRLQQACWTSAGARLCLQGAHDEKGSRARFSLADLALAQLQPLLPNGMQLEGALDAEGQAHMPADGSPVAEVSITTAAGRLRAANPAGEMVDVLVFKPGRIVASLAADGGMQAQVDLPLANGGVSLDASITASALPLMQRPLRGELSLNLDSLGFLARLVPEVTDAQGSLRSDYRFSGTIAEPEINGQLLLEASTLGLATPGLEIHDLRLALTGAGRNLDLRASARSGGGKLAVNGDIALGDAGASVDVQITGEAFQVLDNQMGTAYASPDLSVSVTPRRIDISGRLHVPKAMISPQELPSGSGAVTVAQDQVIVRPGGNTAGDVAIGGRKLHARIRLVVGDPSLHLTAFAERGRNFADTVRRLPSDLVRFEGFGMKAVLVGNLLIVQEPGEPALGSGELRIVAGQYKAYGQDLKLTDSRILFAGGPVAQPALDVRAIRRPSEDVVVGVHVTGRVEQPKLTLFSQPSDMSQAEQLSWLILGRPLSGASSAESSLISRAALALGMAGGNVLTAKLSEELGLDHMGLESGGDGSGEQISLVVGKYLTPRLYVSYGIGLFKPVNTLRLRYTLSRLWAIETKSTGTAAGGDIIFSIELP